MAIGQSRAERDCNQIAEAKIAKEDSTRRPLGYLNSESAHQSMVHWCFSMHNSPVDIIGRRAPLRSIGRGSPLSGRAVPPLAAWGGPVPMGLVKGARPPIRPVLARGRDGGASQAPSHRVGCGRGPVGRSWPASRHSRHAGSCGRPPPPEGPPAACGGNAWRSRRGCSKSN